ncbi:MAG: riboflavin synthase [Actinomycetota bacterium]|nr:riboflavin synthase [Actinomycetota bacterium]
MFTGIVSELGTVTRILRLDGFTKLTVEAPDTVRGITIGDSVALNGVCLTAIGVEDEAFSVEVVDESLSRSALGALVVGDRVNLERPMLSNGRFDGHIVQGHVDGVGRVVAVTHEGEAVRHRIEMPGDLSRYVVEKGSITVDGTSLTITAVSRVETEDAWFEFVVIPHTLAATVLGTSEIGTAVNLEVDVIAKYVERMIGSAR